MTPVPYPGLPSGQDWNYLDLINFQLSISGEALVPGYIYDQAQALRMDPRVPGSSKISYKAFDRIDCR